jgi:hypothetical protein
VSPSGSATLRSTFRFPYGLLGYGTIFDLSGSNTIDNGFITKYVENSILSI